MMRSTKGHPLTVDETRLVRMFKALGNPQRFHIVETLAECQLCLTYEIVATTPLAKLRSANISRYCRKPDLCEVRPKAQPRATGLMWTESAG